MTEAAVAEPIWFSGVSESEGEYPGELRSRPDDPFDWSRRQVALHHRTVYKVALGVLGPGGEAEAEEVAQEAFLRLHAERERFRGESRVATWLHRVAFRLAVDRCRRPRRKHQHVGTEYLERSELARDADDPYRRARTAERAEALERALGGLSEVRRTVIRLHYWLELGVAEISKLLDMPTGTVKSHLYRGRAALARRLKGKGS